MDNTYNSVIEALIFSSDEPISSPELIKVIQGIDGEDTQISIDDVEKAVEELNKKYEEQGIAFSIQKIAHGYVFATKPENRPAGSGE